MAKVQGTSGTLSISGQSIDIVEWSLEHDTPTEATIMGELLGGATFSASGEMTPEGIWWLYELEHPDSQN